MSTNNKKLFSSLLMEKNWVPKSDSFASLSNLESMGDSETELVINTDMVLDTFVSNVIDSDDYDDDAESTSGDDSGATNGNNIGQDMRRQMLCKNWWHDLYDAKKIIVDDGEIIEGQRDSTVLVQREEAVAARDDAESNRLFWDACIAHGY